MSEVVSSGDADPPASVTASPEISQVEQQRGPGERRERHLVLIGGGVGTALLVVSLLVNLVWYPQPTRPVFNLPVPQVPAGFPSDFPTVLPSSLVTDLPSDPYDLPTDVPTGFPDFPELPDLPGGDS